MAFDDPMDPSAERAARLAAESDTASDIVRALRQAWPWAAFMGVLAVFYVVFAIGTGIMMLAGPGLPPEADPFGVGRWIGPVYIVFGLVYILPTTLMIRVAVSSARVSAEDDLHSALRAVRAQRDWWIGMGVLTILTMITACGGGIAAVAGAVFLASRL